MKALRITLYVIAGLVLIAGLGYFIIRWMHLPSDNSEVSLSELSEPATVKYDEYGIPHIYAANNVDAWRTLGYVHARDRLFQMDLLRRVGGGRMAELFGDDLLKVDRFFRTLGTEKSAVESARQFMNKQDEEWLKLSKAYIDGINQYILNNQKPIEYTILGQDPEPFTITDMYRAAGYMSFSFALALKTDPVADDILQNLGPEYLNAIVMHGRPWHEYIPTTNPDSMDLNRSDLVSLSSVTHEVLDEITLPLFRGSNSWVIGPKKSKSGKVLFANDTHIGYAQPSVWYEALIDTPEMKLYGNFLGGFPFPLIGHTDHHAWGLTMFQNDDMDLFRETIEGDKVMYKGEWTDLTKRKETIKSSSGKTENFQVLETPHGPLMNPVMRDREFKDSISCYWTLTKFPMMFPQIAHNFCASTSMEGFRSKLPDLASPGLNVMYGDVDGNYAWWATSKIMKRPSGVNSKLILDGSSGEQDPIGYFDFDDNPRSVNADEGFIYSANNAPHPFNNYYHMGYYYAGARAMKIHEEISRKNDWDIEAMKRLVLTDQSPIYPDNADALLRHIKPKDDFQESVVTNLKNWNGSHQLDEKGCIIYYQLVYHTLEAAMMDELGNEKFENFMQTFLYMRTVPQFIRENHVWWDDVNTETEETQAEIIQKAFEVACAVLKEKLGADIENWRWSDVHTVLHKHPMGDLPVLKNLFNVGPFPIAGGEEVINKQSFWLNYQPEYVVKSGPAMRILIDYSDVENSVSINPTGQSGNPFSAHYADQAEMFVNGEFRKQLMNAEEITEKAEQVVEFIPTK